MWDEKRSRDGAHPGFVVLGASTAGKPRGEVYAASLRFLPRSV